MTENKSSCRGWDSLQILESSYVYLLVDGGKPESQFRELVGQLVDAAVDVIQLRDKWLNDRDLQIRAEILVELRAQKRTLVIVNDRTDIASASGADGVHLGQEDMSVAEAKSILGTDSIVGVSTHSLPQAQRAVLDGANYIGVGPTFPSQTKSFSSFPGLQLLAVVAKEITIPAFAIGGIDLENAKRVFESGIARLAVSNYVLRDPGQIKQKIQALKNARQDYFPSPV